MKKTIACLLLMMAAVGCHTIHIKNGSDASTNYEQTDWHHIGVFRLVEFSGPVNMTEKCDGAEWTSVQTRTGPLQALIRAIPYVSSIYSPMEVKIACGQKTAQTTPIEKEVTPAKTTKKVN